MNDKKFITWFNAYVKNYNGTGLMNPEVVAEQAWQQALVEMLRDAPVVYGPANYDGVPVIWTDSADEDDSHKGRVVAIEPIDRGMNNGK